MGLLLRHGTIVDPTIIHATPLTKNRERARHRGTHQTLRGNQCCFAIKGHRRRFGVRPAHTVTTTATNIAYVSETSKLLHRQEMAFTAMRLNGLGQAR